MFFMQYFQCINHIAEGYGTRKANRKKQYIRVFEGRKTMTALKSETKEKPE